MLTSLSYEVWLHSVEEAAVVGLGLAKLQEVEAGLGPILHTFFRVKVYSTRVAQDTKRFHRGNHAGKARGTVQVQVQCTLVRGNHAGTYYTLQVQVQGAHLQVQVHSQVTQCCLYHHRHPDILVDYTL